MWITLGGKKYRVVLSDFMHSGECDDPNLPFKKIKIKRGLKGLNHLDTIVHETLHACLWMASEEWVAETAADISKVLWRLGYRRIEEESYSLKFEPSKKEGEESSSLVQVESEEKRFRIQPFLRVDKTEDS